MSSSAALFLSLAVQAAPQAIPTTADWSHFVLGQGIGISNLVVSAAGGATEIIAGGSAVGSFGTGGNAYWVILRHNASTNGYDQQWVSPVYAANQAVVRIEAAELVAASAGPELVVMRVDGVVEIWSQASRARLSQFSSVLASPAGLTVADLDGDGVKELVLVSNSAGLAVHAPGGALLWRELSATGTDAVAAQMDADLGLEIAVTSGRVVDSAARAVQWFWTPGFGISLDAGDIDGDGLAELVAAEAWAWVWSYDVDRQLPKWSIPVFNTSAIRLGNLDADPNLEMLVGEAQWGDQSVYDTVTQVKQYGIRNPEHGTTDTAFGDVDNDGVLEILWGAGYSSSGKDQLFVAGTDTRTIEWSSVDLGGPLFGPLVGDLDGDGLAELVALAPNSDSGYSGARILVFDAAARTLRAVSAAIGSGFSQSATGFELVNADADPQLEIVVIAGSVGIYDFSAPGTFTRSWDLPAQLSSAWQSFALTDLDANGRLDAVVGGTQFVHVFDFATKVEQWRTFYLGGPATKVTAVNTDADPAQEIVALSGDGRIYLFDGVSRLPEAILPPATGQYRTFDLYDFPGIAAVVAGDDAGRFAVYLPNGAGYDRIGPFPLRSAALDGLTLLDGTVLAFSGAGGVLALHDGFAAPVWSSANYGTGFGRRVAYASGMLFSAGQYGIAGFRVQ